jgi:ABC-type Na+ transport system ATPase subunit NatA
MRQVLAVNHLTFGAKRGEAFGLLGYNVSRQKKYFPPEIHSFKN